MVSADEVTLPHILLRFPAHSRFHAGETSSLSDDVRDPARTRTTIHLIPLVRSLFEAECQGEVMSLHAIGHSGILLYIKCTFPLSLLSDTHISCIICCISTALLQTRSF